MIKKSSLAGTGKLSSKNCNLFFILSAWMMECCHDWKLESSSTLRTSGREGFPLGCIQYGEDICSSTLAIEDDAIFLWFQDSDLEQKYQTNLNKTDKVLKWRTQAI